MIIPLGGSGTRKSFWRKLENGSNRFGAMLMINIFTTFFFLMFYAYYFFSDQEDEEGRLKNKG